MLGSDRPLFRPPATIKIAAGSTSTPNLDKQIALRQFVARVGGIDNAPRVRRNGLESTGDAARFLDLEFLESIAAARSVI